MTKGKYLYSFVYLLLLFALSGCSASIAIQANADRSSAVQFSMDLGKTLADTVSMAAMMNGGSADDGLFSADMVSRIQQSFDGSDIREPKVSAPSGRELSIYGSIKPPEAQKAVTVNNIKAANFITCTSKSLTVILSPDTVTQLTALLPDDSRNYLDLFMAPIFTGESMDAAEYRDLIAAVYGEELAAELEKSAVQMSLAPPAGCKISSASLSETGRSRTSANKAVFSVPLLEFLTLRNAKTFSITW